MKDFRRTKGRVRKAGKAGKARRDPKVRHHFGLDHAKTCIRVDGVNTFPKLKGVVIYSKELGIDRREEFGIK